jgi:UDP-glucose/iron transport system ATP-binding protein
VEITFMTSIIEVKELGLRLRQSRGNIRGEENGYILKGISFSVPAGGVFAIRGPSGSGKSTLLHLLCRLEEPSEGQILFEGKSLQEYDPQLLRRQLTLVFQTPVLVGPTVFDDLKLGFHFSSAKKSPQSFDRTWGNALLERVHLSSNLLDENPQRLSVGEAQRVCLARALAIEPKVLLLDEPTSALDLKSKKIIEETLSRGVQEGLTLILVSHDLRQIEELSAIGIELASGRIVHQW